MRPAARMLSIGRTTLIFRSFQTYPLASDMKSLAKFVGFALLCTLSSTAALVKPKFNCTSLPLPSPMRLPNSTFFNAVVQLKEPYVMIAHDSPIVGAPGEVYTGVAIDVWTSMAECLGLQYKYNRLDYTTIASSDMIVDAVYRGDYDIAVASIGLTKDREVKVEFTQPFDDTALILLTRSGYTGGETDMWQFSQPFQPSAYWLILIGLVLGVTLLAAFNTGRFELHGMHSVAENRAMRAEVEEGDWCVFAFVEQG
jgi:hypothetical protein